jgi:hypothetical protein
LKLVISVPSLSNVCGTEDIIVFRSARSFNIKQAQHIRWNDTARINRALIESKSYAHLHGLGDANKLLG